MGGEVDQTMWVGNLSDKITEELLHELFLQSGPLHSVKIPKEKDGRQKNFAFVRYRHAVSVPYTIELMNGIRIHGNSLKLQSRPGSIHQQERSRFMDRNQAIHRSNSEPTFGSQWGTITPPTPPTTGMMGPPWQPDWNRGRPTDRGRNNNGGGGYDRSRSPHDRHSRFSDRHSNSPDHYNESPGHANQGHSRNSRNPKHDWESPRDRNGARDRNDSRDRNGMRPNSDFGKQHSDVQALAAQAQQWAMAQNLQAMNQNAHHAMQPRRHRRY